MRAHRNQLSRQLGTRNLVGTYAAHWTQLHCWLVYVRWVEKIREIRNKRKMLVFIECRIKRSTINQMLHSNAMRVNAINASYPHVGIGIARHWWWWRTICVERSEEIFHKLQSGSCDIDSRPLFFCMVAVVCAWNAMTLMRQIMMMDWLTGAAICVMQMLYYWHKHDTHFQRLSKQSNFTNTTHAPFICIVLTATRLAAAISHLTSASTAHRIGLLMAVEFLRYAVTPI